MNNLSYRQNIIKSKRQQTSWRDFVMEIGSRNTVNIYRNSGKLSRYPETGREGSLVDIKDYDPQNTVDVDYDGGSIFPLIQELFQIQPKMRLMQWFENENSDYAEVYGGKNCYLSIGVGGVENTAYSLASYGNLTNIYNSFSILGNCSNIYSSRITTESYNVFYSSNIHNSSNIRLSSNLIGCHDCILCNNIENQSYCINNEQIGKERFELEKNKILEKKGSFEQQHEQVFSTEINNNTSTHITGTGIVSSENIENGYFIRNMSGGRNIIVGGGDLSTQLFYDCFDCGNEGDNNLYGAHYCGENSSHVYCCSSIAHCSNVFYSYFLESCSFCLGCIGLKNKSYCILNKQYTKEEWHQRVDEIFGQMEADGTLGQFFPTTMNPFYFNDTAAYLIDPSFTKEEVVARGYLWRDEPIKVDIPEWMEVVESKDLGKFEGRMVGTQFLASAEGKGSTSDGENSVPTDAKRHIDPIILKKTIRDEEGNVYRVIKLEYDFLVKYGLPLPRKHWLTRMKKNFRIA